MLEGEAFVTAARPLPPPATAVPAASPPRIPRTPGRDTVPGSYLPPASGPSLLLPQTQKSWPQPQECQHPTPPDPGVYSPSLPSPRPRNQSSQCPPPPRPRNPGPQPPSLLAPQQSGIPGPSDPGIWSPSPQGPQTQELDPLSPSSCGTEFCFSVYFHE